MAAEERTLGQLVSDASRDVSELVRYEIALAKAEVQRDIKRGVAAGGLFGAAALLAVYATVALMIAAGLGLAEVMPGWLAFLVVAAGLLLIAGVCVIIGRSQIGRIKPPERTIRSTKETIAAVRNRGGDGVSNGSPER
jgi:hypothetical protein